MTGSNESGGLIGDYDRVGTVPVVGAPSDGLLKTPLIKDL